MCLKNPDWRIIIWTKEALHVVHGSHDARRTGREKRHQRVSISVQEQQVNKLTHKLLYHKTIFCKVILSSLFKNVLFSQTL